MDLIKAQKLAVSLMAEHGLAGWTFSFDNATRRYGIYHQLKEEISLSRHLTWLNDKVVVRETILHEIAHALAPRAATPRRALEKNGKETRCHPQGVQPRKNAHALAQVHAQVSILWGY